MIYLTGDTHGGADMKKLVSKQIQSKLQKEDTLIICGDFGFIWNTKKEARKEKVWLEWFAEQAWTTVFVDGNHECFPRLATYPEKEWHGGKVNEIRPNLFHLKRGEIFEIEGKTFFAMGGAASHDRGPAVGNTKRVIGKYWWPEEIPSEEERRYALQNLEKHDFHVDYIVTHCLPTSLQAIATSGKFAEDELTSFFEAVKEKTVFDHWYSGHYHIDRDVADHVTVLFNRILKAGETVSGSEPLLGSPIYQKGEEVMMNLNGMEVKAKIMNIYPWGFLTEKTQPLYDVLLLGGSDRIVKYVKETDILRILK